MLKFILPLVGMFIFSFIVTLLGYQKLSFIGLGIYLFYIFFLQNYLEERKEYKDFQKSIEEKKDLDK